MNVGDVLTMFVKIYAIGILCTLSYFFITRGTNSAPGIFKILTPIAAVLLAIITVTITVEGYENKPLITERYDDDDKNI